MPSSLILALRGILVFGERLGGEAKGEREWVAPGQKGRPPLLGLARWTEQGKQKEPGVLFFLLHVLPPFSSQGVGSSHGFLRLCM